MLEHSNKTSVFSFTFCSKNHTIRLSLAIKWFFVLLRDVVDFLLYIYNNSVIYILFKYYGKKQILERWTSRRNYNIRRRWWTYAYFSGSYYGSIYNLKFLRLFCRIPTSLQKSQSRSLFFSHSRNFVLDSFCLFFLYLSSRTKKQ